MNYYQIIKISLSANAQLNKTIKFAETVTLSLINVPIAVVQNAIQNSEFTLDIPVVSENNPAQNEFVVKMSPVFNSDKNSYTLFFNFKSISQLSKLSSKVFKSSSANPVKNNLMSYEYSKLMHCTSKFEKESRKKMPQSYLPIEFVLDNFGAIENQCNRRGKKD